MWVSPTEYVAFVDTKILAYLKQSGHYNRARPYPLFCFENYLQNKVKTMY